LREDGDGEREEEGTGDEVHVASIQQGA
jgi:hypothetical protein